MFVETVTLLIDKFKSKKQKSEILSIVHLQPGLCRTLSKTPKTGFLMRAHMTKPSKVTEWKITSFNNITILPM